ncbi:MAG: VTT domain-containing protein [Myxococcales bacterium]|nr:VTT domain-containing protein [Myxococcales bacterium]MCB9541459.1 VTT domain-containing protein [Myxococcales bacterium]
MKRYLYLVIALKLALLALFGLVTLLGVPLLTDPAPYMPAATLPVAALGVALLIADVLIPVPSSLVMVAHGALFGTLGGTLLSLAGSIGAAALGFWIGRKGGPLLDRIMTPEERTRGDRLLARHGGLAIVLSRPLPILAETTAILAGTSPLPWPRLLIAATLGALPPALLYAIAGAAATGFDDQLLIFAAVMGAAALFWLITHRLEARLAP